MGESSYSFAATQDSFTNDVIEQSKAVPVMVDFWAAWCGPCQSLMPILQRLAEDYQGKFLLAKVNSDEQQALAAQYGVRSLPTVKLFKDGVVVDEFMGVQTEAFIRDMIERQARHSPRATRATRAHYCNKPWSRTRDTCL